MDHCDESVKLEPVHQLICLPVYCVLDHRAVASSIVLTLCAHSPVYFAFSSFHIFLIFLIFTQINPEICSFRWVSLVESLCTCSGNLQSVSEFSKMLQNAQQNSHSWIHVLSGRAASGFECGGRFYWRVSSGERIECFWSITSIEMPCPQCHTHNFMPTITWQYHRLQLPHCRTLQCPSFRIDPSIGYLPSALDACLWTAKNRNLKYITEIAHRNGLLSASLRLVGARCIVVDFVGKELKRLKTSEWKS